MCLLWGANWVFISQKTEFSIVTAVKTSNLTWKHYLPSTSWYQLMKEHRACNVEDTFCFSAPSMRGISSINDILPLTWGSSWFLRVPSRKCRHTGIPLLGQNSFLPNPSNSTTNRDSSVGIVSGYRLGCRGLGFRIPIRARIFSCAQRPHRGFGPNEAPLLGARGVVTPKVKQM
jgi:hypothetical protein